MKASVEFNALAELPEGWSWRPLQSLTANPKQDVVDGPFGSNLKASEYVNAGVPIARLQNIDRSTFVTKNIRFLTSEKAADLVRHEFRPDDILITKLGDPLGKACIVPASIGRGVIVADLVRVRPDEALVDRKYLTYAINSPVLVKQFELHTKGTTRPRVNLSVLRELPIPLAPRAQQSEIVAEIEKQFSRLDEAVANLQRVKANLKRYKAAVLKAAVEGRLVETEAELARREGRAYEDASALVERVVSERKRQWTGRGKFKSPNVPDISELPVLPDGWAWSSFEAAAERVTVGHVGSMKDEYVGHGIPFLRSQNVRPNRYDPEGLKYISTVFHASLGKSALRPGDIVVVRSGSVGVSCVIPETLAEANCSDLVIIKSPRAVLSSYGAYYLNSVVDSRIAAGKVGVALVHFNTQSVAELPLPLPPLAEQRRIVAEVDRHLSIIREVEAEVDANLYRAQALRSSVLSWAFSGEGAAKVATVYGGHAENLLISDRVVRFESAPVVMAARVLNALAGEPTMGRVKLQKILFLATYHGKVTAANAEYVRMQAGPLDMPMLEGVIKRLNDLGWFRETARNGKSNQAAYSYAPLTKAGEHKKHLAALTKEQIGVIDQLAKLMRTWSTEKCELLATVYGAWNDLLIWKQPPTVDAIAHEVLENWHEAKRKFSRQKISQMIEEIKRLGIEPSGFGLPTSGSAPDVVSKSLFES